MSLIESNFINIDPGERTAAVRPQFNINTSNYIKNNIKNKNDIKSIIKNIIETDDIVKERNAFYLYQSNILKRTVDLWKTELPFVMPYYAMKSNPHQKIMEDLSNLGVGFDCASVPELNLALNLVDQHKIIYANPVKSEENIAYAKHQDVSFMTFDCIEELEKIIRIYPDAYLVLRIAPNDEGSVMKFSSKFGASYDDCIKILNRGIELEANIVGVSFHVGSGCCDIDCYTDTIKLARKIFDTAFCLGYKMDFLDIGGGFSSVDVELGGKKVLDFTTIARVIKPLLKSLFTNTKIISELGRFLSAPPFTLVTRIIGKKVKIINENKQQILYMSESIYGAFSGIIFDYQTPNFKFLSDNIDINNKISTIIYGHSCDSLDKIYEGEFPDINVGEWLYFTEFGSYTLSSSSEFNGFTIPSIYYL